MAGDPRWAARHSFAYLPIAAPAASIFTSTASRTAYPPYGAVCRSIGRAGNSVCRLEPVDISRRNIAWEASFP